MTLPWVKSSIVIAGVLFVLGLGSAEAVVLTAPSAVTAVATSSTSVVVSWKDSNPELTEFVLQRSLKPDNGFKAIASPSATARSYTDGGLASVRPTTTACAPS